MKGKKHTVVVQKWEESERGWGVRPDGYSLHLSEEDREAYCRKFWAEERKRNAGGGVPDDYERESGSPYLAEVDAATYKKVEFSKYGIRCSGLDYPGSGGTDGWVLMKETAAEKAEKKTRREARIKELEQEIAELKKA